MPENRRITGVPDGNLCYSYHMEITLNIPDELARQVTSEGKDPARVALEDWPLRATVQNCCPSQPFARCWASRPGWKCMIF